jgi:hypothetical protein
VNIHKINNVFTETELEQIKTIINNTKPYKNDNVLGRSVFDINLPVNIQSKFATLVDNISQNKLSLAHIMCVEYSAEHGQPNLPPHFDGSHCDMMIDFQLEANTSWDLGMNTTIYPIEDNSAIIFNPNENIHWRPHKKFKDGEYIRMIFVRFDNLTNLLDYSHLQYSQDHPIFDEARKLRDSL